MLQVLRWKTVELPSGTTVFEVSKSGFKMKLFLRHKYVEPNLSPKPRKKNPPRSLTPLFVGPFLADPVVCCQFGHGFWGENIEPRSHTFESGVS